MSCRFAVVLALFFGFIHPGMAQVRPYDHAEIHPEIFGLVKRYQRQAQALEEEAHARLNRRSNLNFEALVDLRRLVQSSLKLTWTVANPFTTYSRLGEELRSTRRLTDTAKRSLRRGTPTTGVSTLMKRTQEALVRLETSYQKRSHQKDRRDTVQRSLASQ